MSHIKSKNTKPEILVRKFLFSKGFRYKIHDKALSGKPDIVLNKYKTIIFVHGCFWHGHEGCKYFIIPKTRTEWWSKKIYKTVQTVQSDIEHKENLIASGWNVIIIWECSLKPNIVDDTLNDLIFKIKENTNN